MRVLEECTLRGANDVPISVKWFGTVDYTDSYAAMVDFANEGAAQSKDEIWLLEHPQVYTQGTACDMNTLVASDIPVVKTDRGGQITFHGPGQLVMYPLLNLKRQGLGVKSLVNKLEQAVINYLAHFALSAARKQDAPGVYIDGAKIAALGLRIRRGTSYHGLSLNIDMDLTPFKNIDPCGYQGLQVYQLSDCNVSVSVKEAGDRLAQEFVRLL